MGLGGAVQRDEGRVLSAARSPSSERSGATMPSASTCAFTFDNSISFRKVQKDERTFAQNLLHTATGLLARQRLGGLVADCTANFICDLGWNFGHVVGCTRMFCGLLHNVFVSFALRHKVAVHPN